MLREAAKRGNPKDESDRRPLRPIFDRRLKLEFHGSRVTSDAQILVAGHRLARAGTFSDVSPGHAFWYKNANGLVEIAVNLGRADAALGLEVGSGVTMAPKSR